MQQDELVALEKNMTPEDMIAYREDVRKQLHAEEKQREKKRKEDKGKGWFSWLTGSKVCVTLICVDLH